MADLFDSNATSIGVRLETKPELLQKFGGSTDMGNVSHVVPSIHPKFYIGTTVSNHSKPFAHAAGKKFIIIKNPCISVVVPKFPKDLLYHLHVSCFIISESNC